MAVYRPARTTPDANGAERPALPMPRRPLSAARACHFQDSDGNCWQPERRGVCGPPAEGAAALIQHADQKELCRFNPPMGVRPLCQGKDQVSAAEGLEMLRSLRDPARCRYRSCAVVGAGGTLLGARLGAEIDSHEAVIRINLTPDGPMAAEGLGTPHRHVPTWVADVGARTSWRVVTMEVYGYLSHYARFWLQPPRGHGHHPNMSGIPQEPLLAVSCHQPGTNMGRCRADRIRQTFGHPYAASYMINPLLLQQTQQRYFRNIKNQKVPSTGLTAVVFAQQLCDKVHIYGFANGACQDACYHFHECGPAASHETNQSNFYTNVKASGGFHNFSAQARALHRLAREGAIVPHWGRCERNLGDAPERYLNHGTPAAAYPRRRGKRGGGKRGGRGGGGRRMGRGRRRADPPT